MAKQATYEIVINGIKESISAVESLNKQLDALEQRMDKLASKNINVSTSGGDGGARVSALDEEAKMLQQIEQLHQKVAASEKQEYQELLHAKEELKEYQTIAKSIAAQTNLSQNINDTSTMMGMKAQLRDLKMAMQTVDVNGDQFKQWAAEANELTQKLKEAEASYGTFSRNVGNYSNGAYEGIKKFSIEIGGVTKEFESARKALKELKAEMQTLQYKQDKGIITEEETERFKSLVPVVRQLESAIQDAGKPLDNMLDTMQSLVAIASVGQGLSALFGLDESEIEKTIQKLVALQNVLQGLQTIQNQITSKQGIGLFLSKGSGAIDSLTKSIFGVTAASKGATVAVKLFSGALKGLGFGLVIAGISTLIDIVGKWITKQQEAKKAAEELRKETNKNNAALETTRLEMQNTLKTLESFNGSKKEEERIVKDLNSKYGQALGTYKTIAQWKDALKQKTDAYIESLELEFEMQQAIKNLEDAYLKKKEVDQSDASDYWSFWNPFSWGNGAQNKKVAQAEADKAYNDAKEVVTNLKKKMDEHSKKNQINLYSPQPEKETKKKIKDDSKKIENAVEDTQNRINELRIKLTNEGLQKQLRQLDEENRQTINKIKHNSKNVQVELALQERLYLKQRQELITKSVEEFNNTMAELNIKDLENEIDYLTNKIEELRVKAYPKYSTPFTKEEILKEIFRIKDLNEIKDIAEEIERLRDADDLIETPSKNTVEELGEKYKDEIDGLENKTGDLLKDLKSALKKETDVINKYGVGIYNIINDYDDGTWGAANLLDSLNERLAALDEYDKEFRKRILKIVDERNKERQKLLDKEEEKELAELDKEYFDVFNRLTLTNLTKEEQEENNRKLEEYNRKTLEIEQRYYNNRKDLEKQAFEERSRIAEEGYSALLTSISEFLSKANDLEQKQPVLGKSGFINVNKTKENLKEAEATIEKELMRISAARTKLDEDFANNLITPEAMNAINMQLNDLENSIAKTMESIGAKTKEALPELLRQFEQIFQQIGQTAQQMITAFGDLYNYNIQKELDALEDMNQKLQEKYDEQKEIEERHKNEIESIEDELATSRGDRRSQLIDMLNAETQARREAAAEQKRIEAEMKANEHKQEELEKKRARAQYRRDLAQILISGAMAAANGFATKPFLPTGLAMGALATTLATAQYLIAKKQKPYAKGGQLDGGVIKGKRHYAGGISVLGGRANVEGGEYITNRISTANNVALLDFVNSKKHKINLSELIDFYQSPKALKSSSKRVFADGGQLPTMPNIDLGDIMTDVAIVRDDRPVVVSVVDINRKQDDVRRVQILSGLNPR